MHRPQASEDCHYDSPQFRYKARYKGTSEPIGDKDMAKTICLLFVYTYVDNYIHPKSTFSLRLRNIGLIHI
jgi:hypothetical protein